MGGAEGASGACRTAVNGADRRRTGGVSPAAVSELAVAIVRDSKTDGADK